MPRNCRAHPVSFTCKNLKGKYVQNGRGNEEKCCFVGEKIYLISMMIVVVGTPCIFVCLFDLLSSNRREAIDKNELKERWKGSENH